MADTHDKHGARHRQQLPESGLEVVPSSNNYPEVSLSNGHNDLYALHPGAGFQHKYPVSSTDRNGCHAAYAAQRAGPSLAPEKTPDGHIYPGSTLSGAETSLSRRSRKKKMIALTIIAVLIIAGAVVGGVLGSRATRSQDPEAEASPSSDGEGSGEGDAAAAAMTGGAGSPTSVAPGLAPTAVSWGYPHLEVFALTKNQTASVYRVWRDSNATSESAFRPGSQTMQVVGGSVDAAKAPSVAVSRRLFTHGKGRTTNRTEMHIYSVAGAGGYRKYHDEDERWSPYGGDSPGNPNVWDQFPGFTFLSSPAMVAYDRAVGRIETFALGAGSTGAAVHYFRWEGSSDWAGPFRIDGPSLHTWATPAVVAWAGDDTRLDVFAVAKDTNHLLHAYKEAEMERWMAYEDLQGFVTTPPVAVSRARGHIDVFARGGDGGLWHRALDATRRASSPGNGSDWAAWRRLGGAAAATMRIRGQPAAVAVDGRVDVFAWGDAGAGPLLRTSYDGDGRDVDGFVTVLEGGLAGPPQAASDGTGDVHVFAYSNRSELLWLKLGPDGKASGDPVAIANVPYMD